MARRSGSHSEITGPRIRSVAQRLIARHGFAAVSMRQIAAEAGVQAGTIYLYVADKQALLHELMDGHLDTLLAAWKALPKPDDPAEALRRFVAFHLGFHIERPEEVFIACMELRNLTPANFAAIEAKRRAYEAELEAILARGAASGAFDLPDPRLTAMAILAMLTGVNAWYREGGRLARHEVEATYWRLVRRMVRPAPGSGAAGAG